MKLKALLALTLSCVSAFKLFATDVTKITTTGAVVGEWTMDMPAALALAKETQKPVFVCFTGSDWCSWCKLMDRAVFDTETWKNYAKDKIILVWLDFPSNKELVPAEIAARNAELGDQYKVEGFPTYVILSAEGKEIGRMSALRDYTAEKFIKDYEKVLMKPRLQSLLAPEVYADYLATKEQIDAVIEKADAEGVAFRQRMKQYQQEVDALVKKLKAIEDSIIK